MTGSGRGASKGLGGGGRGDTMTLADPGPRPELVATLGGTGRPAGGPGRGGGGRLLRIAPHATPLAGRARAALAQPRWPQALDAAA